MVDERLETFLAACGADGPLELRIADANGMKSWVYNEDSGRDAEYIFTTNVVVSARKPEDVGSLASDSYWQSTPPTPGEWVWTDDYSNVLGAVYRRLRDGDN